MNLQTTEISANSALMGMGFVYTTHNEGNINVSGTSLQGYVEVSFERLVAMFGKPHESDGYKVDAEWDIRLGDGTIATIYNWKNGTNYCGHEGLPASQMIDWHVGGFNRDVVFKVQQLLGMDI